MVQLTLQTGENNPILRSKAKEIDLIDKDIEELVDGMYEVMRNDGIGIAAPQVNISKRIFLFTRFNENNESLEVNVAINPEILSFSKEKDVMEEGCLSLPGVSGKVERSVWIDVCYQDLSGEKITERLNGITARVFQHEYDHIEGVLFIDKLV